jgi:serine/threonine protein kinase
MIPMADLQLGDLIGQGGFGEVHRGKWKDKDVAIKQLFLKKLPSSLVTEFENETQIMSQCSKCAQIVKLLGICIEPGHYSIVMEYLAKGSLYDVLHDDEIELPWKTVCVPIALDIGRGLSYLHDRDILHRDLKSLNIVLNENFGAKITDFGLAKLKLESSSKTSTSTKKNPVGTVRWKAPELFKRGVQYSTASDVYSYGMILWEIASRKLPFSEGADDVAFSKIIAEGAIFEKK